MPGGCGYCGHPEHMARNCPKRRAERKDKVQDEMAHRRAADADVAESLRRDREEFNRNVAKSFQ